MPNSLSAYSCRISGAELTELVRNFVEGYQGGFIPFNRGSLPVVSGISVEVKETDDGYTLSKVTKDGKKSSGQGYIHGNLPCDTKTHGSLSHR